MRLAPLHRFHKLWSAMAGPGIEQKTEANDPESGESAPSLEQVIGGLAHLNQSTEQDFLRIGGKLGEFIKAVDLISTRLTALVEMISGTHGRSSSQALQTALDCFAEMRTRHQDRSGGLGGMHREAALVRESLGAFQAIVANLHAIGILMRVEIARLGKTGADFGNLSSDMRALTGHVHDKVEAALEIGALLIPSIESAMRDIALLEEGQVRDLSGAFANLSAFRDIQNRTRDSSARLGGRYFAISSAFKKLIVSIQFHDMTRQQIEHVIDVLKQVDAASLPVNSAVLALQSSQLESAAGTFAASVASVACNLEEIAGHIGDLADESRTLSEVSKDEGGTYVVQMERGCNDILAHLKRLTEADCATKVTTADLEETIGRMRGSIEEIREIEIQMQRMALNATMIATRMGEPGDALAVLTASMVDLVFESRQRSESLVGALGSISKSAVVLFGHKGTSSATRHVSQDACVVRMLSAVADLHTSGERSIARIAEIMGSGARLRDDLSSTRESFSVGAIFAEAIARARDILHQMDDGAGQPVQGLDVFAQHYTMQTERDVHVRFTGVALPVPSLTAFSFELNESSGGEGEELGDNVEFF